uniref:Uncharacterized protein n=1 Tax=Otus sunia TaxID=257818 RepID=A0A8C8ECI0_9STRI
MCTAETRGRTGGDQDGLWRSWYGKAEVKRDTSTCWCVCVEGCIHRRIQGKLLDRPCV